MHRDLSSDVNNSIAGCSKALQHMAILFYGDKQTETVWKLN